ncbi:hypothetical protein M5K25_015234 [Dendrobium thyrsiflorum]|uniref:Reverse transcriptase zinc-binding domain-containing protein n=1 Tax=Dendrobium thyrsiflorum TaxID=117978 RepID=A0ABD0UQG0_DENTH
MDALSSSLQAANHFQVINVWNCKYIDFLYADDLHHPYPTSAVYICNTLNIHSTGHPLIYLGLPISHKKLLQSNFNIRTKIASLLSGWKAKLLSFADFNYFPITQTLTLTSQNRPLLLPWLTLSSLPLLGFSTIMSYNPKKEDKHPPSSSFECMADLEVDHGFIYDHQGSLITPSTTTSTTSYSPWHLPSRSIYLSDIGHPPVSSSPINFPWINTLGIASLLVASLGNSYVVSHQFGLLSGTPWHYWIRGSILLKTCLKYIENLTARFLFHGEISARKMHIISWKDTCKPRHFGGLGIPSLSALIYTYGCSLISHLYTSFCPFADWCSAKVLYFYVVGSLIFISGDNWNLPANIPLSLKQVIMAAIIANGSSDNIRFSNSNSITFKPILSSFFVISLLLIGTNGYALKISIYCWLALTGGFETADVLFKRGLKVDLVYCFCRNQAECVSHLFFGCYYTFAIISNILPFCDNFLLRPTYIRYFSFLRDFVLNTKCKSTSIIVLYVALYTLFGVKEMEGNLKISSISTVSKLRRPCVLKSLVGVRRIMFWIFYFNLLHLFLPCAYSLSGPPRTMMNGIHSFVFLWKIVSTTSVCALDGRLLATKGASLLSGIQ